MLSHEKTKITQEALTKPNQNMKRSEHEKRRLCGRKWGHPDLDAGPRI